MHLESEFPKIASRSGPFLTKKTEIYRPREEGPKIPLTFQSGGRCTLSGAVEVTRWEELGVRIGELAKEVEVPAKTIRYYEDIGLFPAAPRTGGGYRDYGPEAVELLQFIRKAQFLGLSLSEIKELAEIRSEGNLPCEHLRDLLDSKVADLEERIREMRKLRNEMRRTLKSWDERIEKGQGAIVCPHIEGRPAHEASDTAPLRSLKRKKKR